MTYTKTKIRELRKGIQAGEKITQEQEDMLAHFDIQVPDYEGVTRVLHVQNKIDGVLRSITRKRKACTESQFSEDRRTRYFQNS